MEHSKLFPPSGSERWTVCPASVWHQNNENRQSASLDFGSATHNVVEPVLQDGKKVSQYIGENIEISKERSIVFTPEMATVAQFYADRVREFQKQYPKATLTVEEKVILEQHPDCFGHLDAALDEPFGTLMVIDLKTGVGISVPADAPQLKLYAIMKAGPLLPTYKKIVTCVIQPRDKFGEFVKICEFSPKSLENWRDTVVLPAIENALSDNPLYNPAAEACKWCDFSGECPKQAEITYNVTQGYVEPVPLEQCIDKKEPVLAKALDDEQLRLALEYSDMIKDWAKAVQNRAQERLEKGNTLEGFKLVRKYARTSWDQSKDVAHILYKELKIKKKDLYKEPELKTPKQILELLENNKLKAKRVEELIVKPEGPPTIVPVSDKRQSISAPPSGLEDFADE